MATMKRANNRKVKRTLSRKKPNPVAPGSLFHYMKINKIQTFPITHKGKKNPRRSA